VLPLGVPPRRISTTGLRWDLGEEHKLAYGAVVSSSNHAEDDTVQVTADEAVLFTFELHVI